MVWHCIRQITAAIPCRQQQENHRKSLAAAIKHECGCAATKLLFCTKREVFYIRACVGRSDPCVHKAWSPQCFLLKFMCRLTYVSTHHSRRKWPFCWFLVYILLLLYCLNNNLPLTRLSIIHYHTVALIINSHFNTFRSYILELFFNLDGRVVQVVEQPQPPVLLQSLFAVPRRGKTGPGWIIYAAVGAIQRVFA